MKFTKKKISVCRGIATTTFSLALLCSIGYKIADEQRAAIDDALGTKSYMIDNSNPKYVSEFKNATDIMNELKKISVLEGEEGTAILKNENAVLPFSTKKVNLWGNASYNPNRGMNQAKNTDAVDLVGALEAKGIVLDPTLKSIYNDIKENQKKESSGGWGGKTVSEMYPNLSAPAYSDYQIMEVNPEKFTTATFGSASSGWQDSLTGDINIVTFARPGGEGNTYKPGATTDTEGNKLDQNPLAFSPDELAVIDAARATKKPTIVLLNTSSQFEIDPIVNGDHKVEGIAYIGCPNDYQFTGIVNVLTGEVNATGALADTYAVSSTGSPSMVNFGGDVYSDYALGATSTGEDPRYPDGVVNEINTSSFGGSPTYNGSGYYVEAEGIYTGYNYYETRYFDSVLGNGNATSSKGSISGAWDYSKEVNYTFGYGLSYLDYEEELVAVNVEKSVKGNITATIKVTNKSDKKGKFRAELFVNTPYTDYDKTNKVEKSAIQFLNAAKVEVDANSSKEVKIVVPTKYLASYDYTAAQTYILDGGTYRFAIGNGAHDAVNNVLTHMGKIGDSEGVASKVKTWNNGNESDTDTTTFSKSASGGEIKNQLAKADLNYYLPNTVTYLSRSDWDSTYPVNYNTVNGGKGVSIAASSKKDEWIKEIRNQQYMVKSDDPVKNFEGVDNKLRWENMPAEAINDIDNEFWDKYVEQIPAEEALGAIAHGGSQSDTLTNLNNPVVKQYDGPAGFNSQKLSTNNGESAEVDPYYVDPETEEGKFKDNVHSQTLFGSCFNPELAYRWGKALGNFGLWASVYNVWAGGLNVHRNPYNGRNIEYLSEDAMLTNIMGREFIKGTREMGILVGPKHLGFNDQEYNRAGVAAYMNEQKARETDLRGFQGAIEDGEALGYMCAFNRMGATNVSHFAELHKNLIRGEWNFKGLITTDMMNNARYFNPESCAMATVTQMADFAGENSHLNLGEGGVDATWSYLSPDAIKKDNALVEASRQAMKYQLYAFANTAIKNISTYRVTPYWETLLKVGTGVFYTVASLATVALAIAYVFNCKAKEEK